jgi:hypothetical protein
MGISWGDAGYNHRSSVRDFYITGNAGGLHIETSNPDGEILIDHGYVDCPGGAWAFQVSGSNTVANYVVNTWIRDVYVGGGIFINDAAGVVVDSCTVVCSDNAATPQTPIEISGNTNDVWVTNCSVTLTSAATAPQAVLIQSNSGTLASDNLNFTSNAVYVNSTTAHGVVVQASGVARVCDNDIKGNAGITGNYYGIYMNLSVNRAMDLAIIDRNYIADFKSGIVTAAAASSIKCNEVCIRNNEFEVITSGVMTNCIQWEVDTRTSLIQAQAFGNSCIGNAIPMFTYGSSSMCPILIGGNRGSGGMYSCVGSPNNQITDAQGSIAYQRDASSNSTVAWINFGGTISGWHSINVT